MNHLTATELAQAANRLLEDRADTFVTAPERFSARTVYYYTRAGILPRIRGVRKADRYPVEWAERMVFARRMQQTPPGPLCNELGELAGVDPTTLTGVARVLARLSDDRIAEIAEGTRVRRALAPEDNTAWTRLDTGPNLEIRIRTAAMARVDADQMDEAVNLLEKALM